jgi:WD40 repeat protein
MARVYDLSGQIVARCRGHEKRVEKARFSPRGDRIVTASMDGTARVFDAATGEEQMVIVVGAPSPVRDAHFSPDESVIHTLSSDAVITWWWLDRERLRAAARPR